MKNNKANLDLIFEAAVRIAKATEQAKYLDQACGTDLNLRSQVEKLLRSDAVAMNFLESPPAGARTEDGQTAKDSEFNDDSELVVTSFDQDAPTGLRNMDKPNIMLRKPADGSDSQVQRINSTQIPSPTTRYQIHGEIARGGMGAILKGRDTELGRDLAIKVLLDSHKDNPQVIERFIEEAQIGGQLQHPGIAPVYELGNFSDDRPFFSMKLVKGKTLAKLLSERKNTSDDRAKFLGIFEQICQAMAYAHSRGVIHRDLKPANIMVGAFGEVQVMDWGLAKVLIQGGVEDEQKEQQQQSELSVIQTLRSIGSDAPLASGEHGSDSSGTLMGSVMGTAAYMPPEQALGQVDRMDERSDVFGLGGLLSQILTGKPPYAGKKQAEIFRLASRGKIEYCFYRLDSCGADKSLIGIAKNCLELEPIDRYRHAGIVSEKVSEYLESVDQRLRDAEVGKAREAARAEQATAVAAAAEARVKAERRTRRLQLGLGALVLLFSTVGIATTTWFLKEQKRQTSEVEQAFESKSDFLYAAHMQTIDQAWRNGAVNRVRELLNQHQPQSGKADRRTFEWHYYDRICKQLEAVPSMSYGAVITNLAISPTGDIVALAGEDNGIQIFDLLSLERIATLNAHKREAHTLEFSNDGRTLVSGDKSGKFFVWQRQKNQFHKLIEGTTTRHHQIRLSNDGQHLAIASKKETIVIYELANPDDPTTLAVAEQGEEKINDFAWMHENSQLAVAMNDGSVNLWETSSGHLARNLIELSTPARELLVADNGKHLVTGSEQLIEVYRLTGFGKAKLAVEIGQPEGRFSHLLSLNDRFAICTDQSISLWDFEGGKLAGRVRVGTDDVTSLESSQDGKLIATTVDIDPAITLWDGTTGDKLRTINRNSNTIYALGFDPLGRIVSAGRDKVARVSSTEKLGHAITLTGHKGWVWSVDFSPSGRVLASGSLDSNVIIWDANTGAEVTRLTAHEKSVQFVKFSPTEPILASASRDNKIKFWSTETFAVAGECQGHTAGVNTLDFSADGSKLVSGGDDGSVIVWDVATREILAKHQVEKGQVWAVAFASDGSVAFGGQNHSVSTWKYLTDETPKVLYESDFNITSLRFSGDRMTLACCTSAGTVLTFDYQQRKIRSQPTAHSVDAMTAVFSHDDRSLVSCGSDGKISFRYLKIDEQTIQIDAHDEHIHSVACSPSGKKIASGSWDKTVKIWSVD